MTHSEDQTKKPEWIRVLEEQSWQAELLISGLAIFGSLQLPGLINQFNDWLLVQLPYDMMGWIPYTFIWYLLIAAAGVIAFFIFHFVLRALWIGIIGVLSVYPDGIDYSKDTFSDDYKSKIKKDYPDVNAFNKKLDDQCSTLFAHAFGFIAIILGFTLLIILSGVAGYLLSGILPFEAETISFVIGGILMVSFLLVGILNTKSIREKAWVKKIHYPLVKSMSFFINPFFGKPIGYTMLIFQTNTDNKNKSAIGAMVTVFIIMFGAVPLLIQSHAFQFLEEKFHRELSNPMIIYGEAYEDQRSPSDRILHPIIPSFYESGNMLQVFIPDIRRENLSYYKITPEWEKDENLSKTENRKRKTAYYLEGFHKYHTFYLNDEKLQNLSSYDYTHPNMNEVGYLTLIPTSMCKEGENLLKIRKEYFNEDGEAKEMFIRFVYDPNT